MKPTNGKAETEAFVRAVGRALRLAAKVARKTAQAHHTPLYIRQDGKVVARKP